MAYKLKCNDCGLVFVAASKHAYCPKPHQRDYRGTTFVQEVLETAVDVALTYAAVDTTLDLLEGAGSIVGSIFDWD